MGEHLVVNVDQLSKPEVAGPSRVVPQAVAWVPSGNRVPESDNVVVILDSEGAPLLEFGECRICQEEDSLNNLETPCACSGSLKYAHRKCVQHWCNEKGDITCEICLQSYQPGYTAPPRPPSNETGIDIGVGRISDAPMDMHDSHFLAIADAERQFLESEYDEYNDVNTSGTVFCRSAALILMALLLLRHAVSIIDDRSGDGNGFEDATTFFPLLLLLLRAVGFLLPCYIMLWAINILQRRRQRQEAAALAVARFAIVVASQRRGILVAPEASSRANTRLEQI